MKKKTKKKLLKGNLLLIGFLLICLSYFDLKADKTENLIAENDAIYTNVNAENLLNILDKETGVVLIVDDKKDINKFVNILYDIKSNEKIYVYNSKNDELILEYANGSINVRQSPTDNYSRLLTKLGLYTENYIIESNEEFIETDYKIIKTPMVLFLNNGKLIYSYYLAEKDKTNEELKSIYNTGFSLLNKKN